MADTNNAEVKSISIITFHAKYLSDTFSELPKLFKIKFKADSTFHTNKGCFRSSIQHIMLILVESK